MPRGFWRAWAQGATGPPTGACRTGRNGGIRIDSFREHRKDRWGMAPRIGTRPPTPPLPYERPDALRQRLSVSHGLGLLLAIATTIALSAALLRGGYVNPEAETFIPHYLANAPLMGILFDPAHNDWGSYQARELSYVFDWIDCRFLVFSAAAGFPHFLSLTHYAGAALIAIAIWTFSQRALRLGPAASMALVGLWLTSPCVLLGGNFYRSAKIVSSAALVGASIGAWLHIHAKGRSPGSRCTAVAFALSLVLAGPAARVALKNGKAFPGASPAVVAILKAQEISATSRP